MRLNLHAEALCDTIDECVIGRYLADVEDSGVTETRPAERFRIPGRHLRRCPRQFLHKDQHGAIGIVERRGSVVFGETCHEPVIFVASAPATCGGRGITFHKPTEPRPVMMQSVVTLVDH